MSKWIKTFLGTSKIYDPTKPLIVRVKPSFFEMRNKNDDWSRPLQPLKKHDVTNKELNAIFNNSDKRYLFDIMHDEMKKWKKSKSGKWKPLWKANVTQ